MFMIILYAEKNANFVHEQLGTRQMCILKICRVKCYKNWRFSINTSFIRYFVRNERLFDHFGFVAGLIGNVFTFFGTYS